MDIAVQYETMGDTLVAERRFGDALHFYRKAYTLRLKLAPDTCDACGQSDISTSLMLIGKISAIEIAQAGSIETITAPSLLGQLIVSPC